MEGRNKMKINDRWEVTTAFNPFSGAYCLHLAFKTDFDCNDLGRWLKKKWFKLGGKRNDIIDYGMFNKKFNFEIYHKTNNPNIKKLSGVRDEVIEFIDIIEGWLIDYCPPPLCQDC